MARLVGFASSNIQGWILAGGRMRDLAGGSELVERLRGEVLDKCLKPCGLDTDKNVRFLSRASGEFRMICEDDESAERFVRLWPLVVGEWAPGLATILEAIPLNGADPTAEELDRLRRALTRSGGAGEPILPAAGPLVDRSAPTGGPATLYHKEFEEVIDEPTRRRRLMGGARNGRSKLAERLLTDLPGEAHAYLSGEFATSVEQIASAGTNATIAVIHADGNRMGETFRELERAVMAHPNGMKIWSALSRGLGECTTQAARAAIVETVPLADEVAAARPIVLGGDDLTIILPGNAAIGFAKIYLTRFANLWEHRIRPGLLDELRGQGLDASLVDALPPILTASAGIACVHHHYPFQRAYALSESLCRWAKDQTEGLQSALAFHRVTASGAGDYGGDVIPRELTTETLLLTMGPWTLDRLEKLEGLVEATRALPRGTWREIVTLAYEGGDKAGERFKRLLEVAEQDDKGKTDALRDALAQLGCEDDAFHDRKGRTPILDVETWRALEREGDADER